MQCAALIDWATFKFGPTGLRGGTAVNQGEEGGYSGIFRGSRLETLGSSSATPKAQPTTPKSDAGKCAGPRGSDASSSHAPFLCLAHLALTWQGRRPATGALHPIGGDRFAG
jgi:hypothetical protein